MQQLNDAGPRFGQPICHRRVYAEVMQDDDLGSQSLDAVDDRGPIH
jgi:hypothetical protein